jgi:hypothetical protein
VSRPTLTPARQCIVVLPKTIALAAVEYYMTPSQSSASLARRFQAIVSRIVARVKSKTGCQCRVSTELIASATGYPRAHVWAIAPCRIHMAASGPADSKLAREIESESNAEIARLLGPLY